MNSSKLTWVFFIIICVAFFVIVGCNNNDDDSNTSTTDITTSPKTLSGILDTAFGGGNGYVVHDNAAGGSGEDGATAVTLDSNGNIIAVGYSYNSNGNKDIVIWKYDSSGNLDSNFGGGNGYITYNGVANGNDVAEDVVVNQDGSILIAGLSTESTHNDKIMIIMKYDSSGDLDTTFGGGNGYVVFDSCPSSGNGGCGSRGFSIAIDKNDNILVTGTSNINITNHVRADLIIWKYDSSGDLDTTFGGGNGYVTYNGTWNEDDWGEDLTLDSEGNIFVAGWSDTSSSSGLCLTVLKYDSSGNLDTTFGGGNGYVTYNNVREMKGILLDSNDNIFVAGNSKIDGNLDMTLWKFDSSGNLDTTFGGGNGYITHNAGGENSTNEYGTDLVLDGKENILVTGASLRTNGNSSMVIWKYDSSGNLDTAFGNGKGYITYENAGGMSMTLDSSGMLIVAGGSNENMTVWRYK